MLLLALPSIMKLRYLSLIPLSSALINAQIIPNTGGGTIIEARGDIRIEDPDNATTSDNGFLIQYFDDYYLDEIDNGVIYDDPSQVHFSVNQRETEWIWSSDSGARIQMQLTEDGKLEVLNPDDPTGEGILLDGRTGVIYAKGIELPTTGSNFGFEGNGANATGFRSVAFGTGSGAGGDNSAAFAGGDTFAKNSLASGLGSRVYGDYATALNGGYADGDHSLSIGAGGHAQGAYSFALGEAGNYDGDAVRSIAGGSHSFVMGMYSQANGLHSYAFGRGVGDGEDPSGHVADGDYSMVFGQMNIAAADYSVAIGKYLQALAQNTFVIGRYNLGLKRDGTTPSASVNSPEDPIFEVGFGDGTDEQDGIPENANALTIYRDGLVDIPQMVVRGDILMGDFN